ncbi:MAG: OadG family protein [Desulfococcaceae bacterium]|nr:OadG family protein [Desulfococcaceae bacterium]
MTGLEAIEAHNGWSIAVVGISIVFTGLVLLSATIAQLHKILALFEKKDSFQERLRQDPEREKKEEPRILLPADIRESARHFRLLATQTGDVFPLPKLLDYAVKRGLYSPHSALNELLRARAIVPDGNGYYKWNKNVSC